MDYTTPNATPSSPPRVYDLDTLKSEAKRLDIEPDRANIRRIRRAFDLIEKGRVKRIGFIEGTRIYEITSQTRLDHRHLAVSNRITQCTCEDARRQENYEGCKHSIAVRITERQTKDTEIKETYQAWISDINPTRRTEKGFHDGNERSRETF